MKAILRSQPEKVFLQMKKLVVNNISLFEISQWVDFISSQLVHLF